MLKAFGLAVSIRRVVAEPIGRSTAGQAVVTLLALFIA
eukprot:SAG22_NODE_16980_length_313_cov_1.214953_1_plen_37_part_10